MRIVRGRHYENLTDDLSEVALLRRRVPGIKRYYEHLHQKRDKSRKKRGMSPHYGSPAFNMVASGQKSKHRAAHRERQTTGASVSHETGSMATGGERNLNFEF